MKDRYAKKSQLKNPKKIVRGIIQEAHQGLLNQESEKPIESPGKMLADTLKTLSEKKARMEESQIHSLEHSLQAKAHKQASKRSHGTTPGELLGKDAPPDHIHVEGKRWIDASRKKTADQTKTFLKKSLKK